MCGTDAKVDTGSIEKISFLVDPEVWLGEALDQAAQIMSSSSSLTFSGHEVLSTLGQSQIVLKTLLVLIRILVAEFAGHTSHPTRRRASLISVRSLATLVPQKSVMNTTPPSSCSIIFGAFS